MSRSYCRLLADWGTSRLRLFLCQGNAVLGRRDGPGLGALKESPEEQLRALAGDWLDQAEGLLICGMAGARGGWRETPYIECPASLESISAGRITFTWEGLPAAIVPGLSCRNAQEAPDVLRGEETQALGALMLLPELMTGRRLLIAPGTHSKWIEASSGCLTRFSTVPTGEMFAALGQAGTLIGADGSGGPSEAGIRMGLARRAERAETPLTHLLFETRARRLREALPPEDALGFLSGLLIADEVQGGLPIARSIGSVALAGDPALTRLYRWAFEQAGVATSTLDGDACVLAGLRAIEALDR